MNGITKRRLLAGFFLFHLAILATGMTSLREDGPKKISHAIKVYQSVTGAGMGFGFFSPNVSNQLIIEFLVRDQNGVEKVVHFEKHFPREVAIRMGNMYRVFTHQYDDEKKRRSVAASLVANVFEKYPQAESITFKATAYQFPGLEEFAVGERPNKQPVYEASFRKRNS